MLKVEENGQGYIEDNEIESICSMVFRFSANKIWILKFNV